MGRGRKNTSVDSLVQFSSDSVDRVFNGAVALGFTQFKHLMNTKK